MVSVPDKLHLFLVGFGLFLLGWTFTDARSEARALAQTIRAADSAAVDVHFPTDSILAALGDPALTRVKRDQLIIQFVRATDRTARARAVQSQRIAQIVSDADSYRKALWFNGAVAGIGAMCLAGGLLMWRDLRRQLSPGAA